MFTPSPSRSLRLYYYVADMDSDAELKMALPPGLSAAT